MTSRAEILQICDELEINRDDLTVDEMKDAIKKWSDKKIGGYRYFRGETEFSIAFIKLITEEYDYILEDREGKVYSWRDL